MPLLPYESGYNPAELSWCLLGVSPVAESYEEARIQCISKVEAVIAECRRTNLLFLDNHFDIENDLFANQDCLYGLDRDWLDENSEKDNRAYPLNDTNLMSQVLKRTKLSKLSNGANRQLDSSTYPFEPPKSVHRVPWIFKDPQFMTDSSSGYDVKQGVGGKLLVDRCRYNNRSSPGYHGKNMRCPK
ncbi:hypothetical protein TrVGV298_007033 [Trichoderma virens]|nr:hypothetical protein TrVGV298_007033 [Trichoderma virens]